MIMQTQPKTYQNVQYLSEKEVKFALMLNTYDIKKKFKKTLSIFINYKISMSKPECILNLLSTLKSFGKAREYQTTPYYKEITLQYVIIIINFLPSLSVIKV